MRFHGRRVVGGRVEGETLMSLDPVSFFGGVDPETGTITEPGHAVEGKCITGKAFFFPTGKGSTVGSYVIYRMKKLGTAPAAIVNVETEAIIATGCVLAGLPLLDRLNGNPFTRLRTGDLVLVDADKGFVETLNS